MKTKHLFAKRLFGFVAVIATVGLARSAQAGVSISFNLGLPVPVFHAPRSVAVYTPPGPPPVVHCPSPVVYVPAPRCVPVGYLAPRYERHYDYRDPRGHDQRRHGREERGHGRDGRGSDRSGRR
jgi:hypothetical protein